MEAAATKSAGKRELSGEKAQRIINAMRASVAARGIAGSTFEHVAGEAGVSRGLLHYYFGTKERLLVEVVRRDTELRVARLDEPLAAAKDVDDVLDVLVSSLLDTIEHEPGVFGLLFEVFSAGRRNEEIRREVADLFRRTRDHVAVILEDKEREGAVALPFGAGPTVSYLIAIADGIALQVLSDPDLDQKSVIEAGRTAATSLLRP
jgi:AcrR family transcriptional regulator